MKPGRPPDGEEREPKVTVSFKADPELLSAIAFLTSKWKRAPGVLGSIRSDVLRGAVLEAATAKGWKGTPPAAGKKGGKA